MPLKVILQLGADYTEPTRQLGQLIDEPALAESYIKKSQTDIKLASERLQQRYPKVKRFAVVQFADANNMRMYVKNSSVSARAKLDGQRAGYIR